MPGVTVPRLYGSGNSVSGTVVSVRVDRRAIGTRCFCKFTWRVASVGVELSSFTRLQLSYTQRLVAVGSLSNEELAEKVQQCAATYIALVSEHGCESVHPRPDHPGVLRCRIATAGYCVLENQQTPERLRWRGYLDSTRERFFGCYGALQTLQSQTADRTATT